MDVTQAIAPRSDQLNAEDFLPADERGARTFTISDVRAGTTEQPIRVHLLEGPEGRPWSPAKTMSKLMRIAWGKESDNWIGKRVTLYCDPDIMFGPMKMGGIRISHMSGIGRTPMTANLATTRGKRAPWTVHPLPDDAPPPAKVPTPMDRLVWAFNAAKIPRDDRLDYCRNVVLRDGINEPKDLTEAEIGTVVESLQEAIAYEREQENQA